MRVIRTIRTKLLAAFLVIIITLIQVSYFLYHSNQIYINDYDEILRRFLLLNEITQTSRDMSKTVAMQLQNPGPRYLSEYAALKQTLLTDQGKIGTFFTDPNNQLAVNNYKNIITSYIELADMVISHKQLEDTERYAKEYQELENLKRYLQEYAQSLYDIELTNYHRFYADTVKENESLRELSTLMIICTAGFSILFVFWFSTGISRPITRLANAAKRSYLRNGVFHFQPVEVNSGDEVEILAQSFNTMGQNIQHMVSEMNNKAELVIQLQKQEVENLEVNHLLKEMELKALQNQIHPHFLFNTLNVISKLAYIEGAERSSELMISLSNLLRYNLRRIDAPVTVSEELNHVKEYIRIQETRFGERVRFVCEADPALLDVEIPCLTIQPLVENAFIHGIEEYEEGGTITVRVYRESGWSGLAGAHSGVGTMDGRYETEATASAETTSTETPAIRTSPTAVVEISDNGLGMSEDTLKRLMRMEQNQQTGEPKRAQGHSTGIGLRNVVKRLMFFCKKEQVEQVIQIESKAGMGTTIRLFLPLDPPMVTEMKEGAVYELEADSRG
ncbi:sensor histidine kinase [Brevibacillus dissolubilis]|uniref:sensor histidine kinase n=1 Tax=Brevibacillus dissolubilis TaxID=1844116 RepID=UPI001115D286|nr:sensor histidine kinase [Brevibacillus dissolubilis]